MVKELSDMTLEELWQLFPIILTKHEDKWKDWYNDEERRIKSFLKMDNIKINHIGSTSIKGIWAKPTIDILVQIPIDYSMKKVKNIICNNGYLCMSESEKRISFNRGYTKYGFAEKVYHLHLRFSGDNDELYFRDYLNDHSDISAEYEKLKLSLWKQYEHNRDGYTEAKGEFIRKYTLKAKDIYKGRY